MVLIGEVLSKLLSNINKAGNTETKPITINEKSSSDDLGISGVGHQRLKILSVDLTLQVRKDLTKGNSLNGYIKITSIGSVYRPYADNTVYIGEHKVILSSTADSDGYFKITLYAGSNISNGDSFDCNTMFIGEVI